MNVNILRRILGYILLILIVDHGNLNFQIRTQTINSLNEIESRPAHRSYQQAYVLRIIVLVAIKSYAIEKLSGDLLDCLGISREKLSELCSIGILNIIFLVLLPFKRQDTDNLVYLLIRA